MQDAPEVDPRLAEAMARYREFVVSQERLLDLENFRFDFKQYVVQQDPDDPDAAPQEVLQEETGVAVRTAKAFADWAIRTESRSQGQDLVLVGTPSGGGFGVLGGVLQGHPTYGRQARQNANNWSIFFLRWLNPDLPQFGASYDGRREVAKGRFVDRILLSLRDDNGDPVESWRLVLDGESGQPLYLEVFDVSTFEVAQRLVFGTLWEKDGIRFPKRCEIFDGQGDKTAAMLFDGLEVDLELDEELFEKPGA